MARKKIKKDVVNVELQPAFAQVAMTLVLKAAKGEPLTDHEREGLKVLADSIRSATVNYVRGL